MFFILDRDGVINFESPDYIKSPDEWIPIPGSIEAIAQLSKAGHTIVIATNQSGIARGLYDLSELAKIHQKMIDMVEKCGGKINAIYFCPHHPDEGCECRKPKPGMLLQIMKDFSVHATEITFIGDSARDYEACQAAGCRFILVKTGNGRKTVEMGLKHNVLIFDDLAGAAIKIVVRGGKQYDEHETNDSK